MVFFLVNFLLKFLMCFFKVKHSFGHISGMVGPTDVKQKVSASVGYWVYYVTLTLDLTYDLDLRFCEITFWNSCISGIVGLIDVKWKGSKLIRYQADYMTFPFDHTHDLDLEVSRSVWSFKVSVWNTLISGMEWLIDMEWKGCESSMHGHDIDLYVTMVEWVDVPDSDQGNFRRRHAINISGLLKCSYPDQ